MKSSYKKYLAFALAATMLFSACGTTAAPETPAESNKPAETTPSTTTPAAPEAPAVEEEDKYQLEDIVIAKLYSARPTDRQDVIAPEVLRNINWELLDKLATAEDEAMASALNEFCYREFRDTYEEYARRYRP